MFRCKSTNVDLYVRGGKLTCTEGVILETMLTDDEFYYKTRSHTPDDYGVQVTFEELELFGDLNCQDPERKNCVNLVNTALTGGISGYPLLRLTEGSTWVATKDSQVTIVEGIEAIDAAAGVTIRAKAEGSAHKPVPLPSGGTLVIE